MTEYRWASCSKREFGWRGQIRHVVRRGALDTLCGASASHSEIWRGDHRKPNCTECEKIANEKGLEVIG
jgi:hypothetical protein